jgi:hypothetical protein
VSLARRRYARTAECQKVLDIVPDETRRALQAQWAKTSETIREASGEDAEEIGSQGRLYADDNIAAWKQAKTKLGYGDYLRSLEIAQFFSRTGFALPDADGSAALDENIDYQDVKLKIVQQEGYDEHDFNLFDDRASQLWRKPYIDGAVQELTSGDTRTVDQLRGAVEQMMLAAGDRNSVDGRLHLVPPVRQHKLRSRTRACDSASSQPSSL